MSKKVKIIAAGLNLVCLLATISMPDSTTPFILLMSIISAAAWAFVSPEHEDDKNFGIYVHVILAVFAGAICILLGVTSSVVGVNSNNLPVTSLEETVVKYIFQFNRKVIFLADKPIDYIPVALGILALVIILTVGDIVNTQQPTKECVYSHSIASHIERKIRHIR